ncbi:MAG: DUF2911 domain-containing protein [Chitinophagaceae bacterium]|nr:DUF2911 domain-containing protein [Chitinophagaceae bacterium]
MRKAITLLVIFQLTFLCLIAQNQLPAVDKSPMDMSYFPANYPVQKIQDKITQPLAARVIYSRPQKAGRTIFGGLVKYGEVWRLGANEATEIEFFKQVRMGGKKINKGRYTLYAIVNENNTWTFILNKETDTWGSFKYDAKKDIARTTITTQKTDVVESLSILFEKTSAGFNLVVAWDTAKVSLPFSF